MVVTSQSQVMRAWQTVLARLNGYKYMEQCRLFLITVYELCFVLQQSSHQEYLA